MSKTVQQVKQARKRVTQELSKDGYDVIDGVVTKKSEPRTVTVSKIIDSAWRSILEQTIPPETHPDLVKTYKRFFYAGAKALLDNLVYTDTLDESDEATATPQDVNRVDAVMHEINAFFTEVAAGRQ